MSLRHLSDSSVLSVFATLVRQNQQITAALIAHILEIEHRQLYRELGYGSIRSFLIGEHHLSEDAAEKRVQAAHAVRRFPRILDRIADGRLHLSAVLVLSGSIDESNAEELLDAATHKTRSQIEALLRARKVSASSAAALPEMDLTSGSHAGEPASRRDDEPSLTRTLQLPAPGRVQSAQIENGRLSQVTLRESTREKLRRAHDLLAGSVPFGDHDRVIDQALNALIRKLEKRKFGATSKPRVRTKPSENPRTIPAEVRRAVFERDGGCCTFVGPTGHRCESRAVEIDHVVPIARGGTSMISNVRLLCRPHNQLEAERAFGRDFMDRKRGTASTTPEHADIVAALRELGFHAVDARRAADACKGMDGSLEERVRAAIARLGRRVGRRVEPVRDSVDRSGRGVEDRSTRDRPRALHSTASP